MKLACLFLVLVLAECVLDTMKYMEVGPLVFGGPGTSPVDGSASTAIFGSGKLYLTMTRDGTSLIAFGGGATIRKVDIASGVVSTIAGLAGSFGFTDGVGVSAGFNAAGPLTALYSGSVALVDSYRLVRSVTAAGAVATLAGDGGARAFPASSAVLGQVDSITSDYADVIYVSDMTGGVRLILTYPSVQVVTLFPAFSTSGYTFNLNSLVASAVAQGGGSLPGCCSSSTTSPAYRVTSMAHGGQDGRAKDILYLQLQANGVNPFYLALFFTHTTAPLAVGGLDIPRVVAGGAQSVDVPVDGRGTSAAFSNWGSNQIASDASGTLYVTDGGCHAIRAITPIYPPSGYYSELRYTVKTLAGLTDPIYGGYSNRYGLQALGSPSIGTNAAFSAPVGIAVSFSGDAIYVGDGSSGNGNVPGFGSYITALLRKPCPLGYTCDGSAVFPCKVGRFCDGTSATGQACPPGKYSPNLGSAECLLCPRGSWGGLSEATTCTPCAAGKYGLGTGLLEESSACGACEAGTFTDSAGASSCTACPAGKFSALAQNSNQDGCLPCPPGTVSTPGLSACTPCTSGTYAASPPTQCLPCDRGTFGIALAASLATAQPYASPATACLPCPMGSFAGAAGSLACSLCAPGKYSDAPRASQCTDIPPGTFSNAAGANASSCAAPCPRGFYNEAPGQTYAGCVMCSAGRASFALGASSAASCQACSAGSFAALGASNCSACPPGHWCAAQAEAPTPCPIGTYSAALRAVSGSTCTPCPGGVATASAGAQGKGQCLPNTVACPGGTQPSASGACVPLLCQPPLVPSDDVGGLAASTACKGCAPGTSGTPAAGGACAKCPTGQLCPGLLSRPLLNFSAASSSSGSAGARRLAVSAREAQLWGGSSACRKLAPAPPAPGASASALSDPLKALIAGAALVSALLACAFLAVRMSRSEGAAFRLLRVVDTYKMAHAVEEGESPIRRATVPGGLFTVMALASLLTYSAYMVVDWVQNNASTATGLAFLDDATSSSAAGMPIAAAPMPWAGLPAPAQGLVLRLTVDGEPGACLPLAPPQAKGLAGGAWAPLGTPTADCGGSGAAQATYTCANCRLTQDTALFFSFHYSCQSLLLELVGVSSAGSGAAPSYVNATWPPDGGLHSSLAWSVTPLLSILTDNSSVGVTGSVFSRFEQGLVLSSPKLAGGDGTLADPTAPASSPAMLFTPAAASFTFTLSLPLSNIYQSTVITQRTPLGQLATNILAILGSVLGGFGVLFGVFESPPWAAKAKKRAGKGKEEPEGVQEEAASSKVGSAGEAAAAGTAGARAGSSSSSSKDSGLVLQSAAKVVPMALTLRAETSAGAASLASPAAASAAAGGSSSSAAAALPAGWTRAGPSQDGHFWYEGPNGESQWEHPLALAAAPAPLAISGRVEILPPGWHKAGPSAEGAYWYEGPNGESQWEPPAAASAAARRGRGRGR